MGVVGAFQPELKRLAPDLHTLHTSDKTEILNYCQINPAGCTLGPDKNGFIPDPKTAKKRLQNGSTFFDSRNFEYMKM